MKDQKVVGRSQHSFPKDKLYLTNLTAFREMAVSVDKGKSTYYLFSELSKAFSTVCRCVGMVRCSLAG